MTGGDFRRGFVAGGDFFSVGAEEWLMVDG